MKRKRVIGGILALVMCFSLVTTAWAAGGYASKLISRDVDGVFGNHYIVYTYNGKTYRSDQTSGLTNYAAWTKMDGLDKRNVTRWYAGFSSQLDAQFSGVSEMQKFSRERSGWKQAGNVLKNRLAAADYPELKKFYGGSVGNGIPRELLLTDAVRTQLTAKELEKYDDAANAYGILYRTGLDAYNKLIDLKQEQVNTAVTAISSGLIDIIMKYSIPPKPGDLVEFAKDEVEGYIKDYLKIEDELKDLAGIKKLTGEDKRIDSEKAAKAIEMYWQLICIQQKLAEHCMRKCLEQQAKVESLQADCGAIAARRETEKAAAEAARQQQYEEAVNAQVAQLDLDPDINVEPQNGESPSDYDNRRLQAAKQWAKDQYDAEELNMAQLWVGGYDTIPKTSKAYFNSEVWMRWSNSATDFFSEMFKDYLALTDPALLYPDATEPQPENTLPGCEPMLLKKPEELFQYFDYDKLISAVYAGYDNTIAALKSYETAILECIAAREQMAKDYRTGAQPLRNRVYSLTKSHCIYADEGYGNWGIDDSYWTGFNNGYLDLCDTLGQRIESMYPYLDSVRAEIEVVKENKAEYQRMQAAFEAGLPALYEFYAYSQDDLDYGLWLAVQSINKLEALQSSYPSWLKNHTYDEHSKVLCTVSGGWRNEELCSTFFTGVSSVSQQYAIIEEQILPVLKDYLHQETELLADLDKANAIIAHAVNERTDDEGHDMGQPKELENLNKLQLGDVTIKNHFDMMEAFVSNSHHSYYDYRYHVLNEPDVDFPTKTAVLAPLIDDLRGESRYMEDIRALHGEILEKQGELMRKAQNGEITLAYVHNNYIGPGNDSNFSYGIKQGIYKQACQHSYTSSDVYNYWYENIRPIAYRIMAVIDPIYYAEFAVNYCPVTGLSKGGGQPLAASADVPAPVAASDLSEAAPPLQAAPEVDTASPTSLPGTASDISPMSTASDISPVSSALDISPVGSTFDMSPLAAPMDLPPLGTNPDRTLQVGETAQLLVTVEPANATIPDLVWSSSDSDIATVDENGTVTALLPGTAIITATALDSPKDNEGNPLEGFSVEFTVEVKAGECSSLAELGSGFYLLNPKVTADGTVLTVTGKLGTNGTTDSTAFLNARVVAAAYDGGLFVASGFSSCTPYNSGDDLELCDLSITVPLAGRSADGLTVKVYLLDGNGLVPADGFAPQTIKEPAA